MTGAIDHLPGCIMLVCAFLLLAQTHAASRITLCRISGIALTAQAVGQGYAQTASTLYLTATIVFLSNVLLLPLILRRFTERIVAVPPAIPGTVSIMLGIGLFGTAILTTSEIHSSAPLAGGGLAIALSIMLLSVLMVVRQRDLPSLLTAFLCIGNALLLTAVTLPTMPFLPEFALVVSTLAILPAVIFGPPDNVAVTPAGRPGA